MIITSSNLSKKILISQDIEILEDVIIENGVTLHFCGGRLVNKSTTGQTFYIQGDDVTIIAGPEQIFEGSFDFRRAGKWVITLTTNPTDRNRSKSGRFQINSQPGLWNEPIRSGSGQKIAVSLLKRRKLNPVLPQNWRR